MLFDPAILSDHPFWVLSLLAIVMVATPIVASGLVLLLSYPLRTALTVGVGLAQIGEFSFILAELGRDLALVRGEAYDLVLAVAIISIALNPLLFLTLDPLERFLRQQPFLRRLFVRDTPLSHLDTEEHRRLRGHTVLCGYGRVGGLIGDTLRRRGFTCVVIEQDQRIVERLRADGVAALYGDAATRELLERVQLGTARQLVVAVPDSFTARLVVERARELAPDVRIVARTHSDADYDELRRGPVNEAVLGERELAIEMTRFALQQYGVSAMEAMAVAQGLRRRD
jgi:CPA2 family monovalent cation:H+ antiporter-2